MTARRFPPPWTVERSVPGVYSRSPVREDDAESPLMTHEGSLNVRYWVICGHQSTTGLARFVPEAGVTPLSCRRFSLGAGKLPLLLQEESQHFA
jgi:hypothetical protein